MVSLNWLGPEHMRLVTRKREVELESELAHDYSTNDCSTTFGSISIEYPYTRWYTIPGGTLYQVLH